MAQLERSKQNTIEKIENASVNWEAIAATPEFKGLMRKKKAFIIPATIFFVIYYFALPYFTGYYKFLNAQVSGALNWAYLFALSQFFMAWILAFIYAAQAKKYDEIVTSIVNKVKGGK